MKLKKSLLVVFGFLFLSQTLQAQDLDTLDVGQSNKGTLSIHTGLFADNLLHPGLKFGTSYLFSEKVKTKKRRFKFSQNKYGDKVKMIKYTGDAQLGFYSSPNSHLGVIMGVGITRLRTKPRKLKTFGWSFEVNYLRRMYNIETYELDQNGNAKPVNGAGGNSLMFALSPSYGRILNEKNGLRIYFEPSLQVQKYNHSFVPNVSFELGTTLNLKKL